MIHAELGGIDRFDGPKAVISYIGLNPVICELPDSRIGSGISKREPGRVQWLLVQAIYAAVPTCDNEYLSRFHERIASRKNSKKAIVAPARKILVSTYHLLDRGEVFNPPGVNA